MTQQHSMNPITEDDIANFLVHTPDFFVRHAEVLAQVRISSPHGQRAVSLQERQADMLREKIRALETRLMEMIRNGNDNLILTDRLHRWSKHILLENDPQKLAHLILVEIQNQFMVPQVAMRLWSLKSEYRDHPLSLAHESSVQAFASSLFQPYCGPNSGFEAIAWLEDPKAVQSIAMFALRKPNAMGPVELSAMAATQSAHHQEHSHDQPVSALALAPGQSASGTFGLLILASPDPQRYHAGMGTDFLERIGDLASAALSVMVE
jgi:uncharacterized protein YigA (DUF484 family)